VTTAEIRDRIITDVDEDPAAPTTGLVTEVLAAINEGQQLAALLTLCLEKTVSFTVTAATCFFTPRSTLTDLIVPLRITVGGIRIRPGTIADLEAENSAWQATADATTRYAVLGCNLMAFTPQAVLNWTAAITLAYSPATLSADGDIPAIPEAYHQNLVDYGVYRVRMKEGAQGLERGLGRLNTYLDDMTRLGNFVRTKSLAARYDVQPFELQNFDRSRMISEVLKWQRKQSQLTAAT